MRPRPSAPSSSLLTLVLGASVLTACAAGDMTLSTGPAASGSTTSASAPSSATPDGGNPASGAVRRELLEPRPGLYAEASRAGNMVWTAGQLPEGLPSTASIEDQVTLVLDSLEETLENAGAGFDTVVKANVYLTSWDDWEAFNTIYSLRFSRAGGSPPRSVVAVSELGLGYRVEIELVALVRETSD